MAGLVGCNAGYDTECGRVYADQRVVLGKQRATGEGLAGGLWRDGMRRGRGEPTRLGPTGLGEAEAGHCCGAYKRRESGSGRRRQRQGQPFRVGRQGIVPMRTRFSNSATLTCLFRMKGTAEMAWSACDASLRARRAGVKNAACRTEHAQCGAVREAAGHRKPSIAQRDC